MTILSPLGQFRLSSYAHIGSLSLTNFSLTCLFFIGGVYFFLNGGVYSNKETLKLSSSFIESVHKALFLFLYNLTFSGLGQKGKSYFGAVGVLFISVFSANLLGLIPYSFTLTSHITIALGFSVPVFIAMTGEAISRHKTKALALFLPAGAPLGLIPLLCLIEFISFGVRVFSLAIRLAANLIAGHVILKLIAVTCASLFSITPFGILFSAFPLAALFIFYILEFAVAGLQAYVFAVLCCNYLNEALSIGD